jgi:hypothetical protein
VRTSFDALADVALAVLPEMYDSDSGLFSHKTRIVDGRYENEGVNAGYSAAAVTGLLAQRKVDPDGVLPIGRALDSLHAVVAASTEPALRGNVLWASALAGDRRAGRVLEAIAATGVDAIATSQVGQLLVGVVAAGRAFPEHADAARTLARSIAAELLARHAPRSDLFTAGRFRLDTPRVNAGLLYTSFANQAYPLLGLAELYRWTEEAPAPEAVRVAERVAASQGPLGQWWWLYAVRSQRVLEGYPVYSVHQDGMAFMALAPWRHLGIGPFDAQLELGLRWLEGANELGESLVASDPPFICRCIMRSDGRADGTYGMSARNVLAVHARSVRHPKRDVVEVTPDDLAVLGECRSYHLGWLLYAHSLVAD